MLLTKDFDANCPTLILFDNCLLISYFNMPLREFFSKKIRGSAAHPVTIVQLIVPRNDAGTFGS